jgi:hypothetical protein
MRSFFRGLLVMLIGFMVSQNVCAQEDVLSVNNVWGAAADKKFGWSLGNIAGYYDPISNRGDATFSLIKLNWHLPYIVRNKRRRERNAPRCAFSWRGASLGFYLA